MDVGFICAEFVNSQSVIDEELITYLDLIYIKGMVLVGLNILIDFYAFY